jgi:hypothetical protein
MSSRSRSASARPASSPSASSAARAASSAALRQRSALASRSVRRMRLERQSSKAGIYPWRPDGAGSP